MAARISQPNSTAGAKRVGVISEDLSGPPDEGIKKFTLSMAAALAGRCDASILVTEGESPRGARVPVRCAPSTRSFLGGRLRGELADLQPDWIIYAARSSATPMSFVRSRVLKAYCPSATIALVGLQERRIPRSLRPLIHLVAPDVVFVQSRESQRHLSGMGCAAALLPSGVDLDTFRPVSADRRRELRWQYGIAQETRVALHVGHLKVGRGVRVLADLA